MAATNHFGMRLTQVRALTMTPQLRQAIGLLRLTNAELAAYLAEQAARNPAIRLEAGAPGGEAARKLPAPPSAAPLREGADTAAPSAGLHAHATTEIGLLLRDPRQRAIAAVFVEALEPSGWLGRPLPEIARDAGCSLPEAEAVLALLQRIEPAGLFARSLAECLRLQAADRGELSPAMEVVLDNLGLLAQGEVGRLARLADTTEEEVRDLLRLIRSFDPKPGAAFGDGPAVLRPPDLVISHGADGWQVELNRAGAVRIVVRDDCDDPRALAEARWLERVVTRRNATTLKVAAEAVRRQQSFLTGGPAELRPMSFAEVAAAVGMHESTVSRVTAGLTVAAPQGVMALRDFFSVALRGRCGETHSAAAVRDAITRLVAAEDPARPLSDEALAAHFAGQGVEVARRTIAKYRKMLRIPSSSARRRRARLGHPG